MKFLTYLILRNLNHIAVLYPHVGSATVETRSAMAVLAGKNLLSGLEGKPMPAPV